MDGGRGECVDSGGVLVPGVSEGLAVKVLVACEFEKLTRIAPEGNDEPKDSLDQRERGVDALIAVTGLQRWDEASELVVGETSGLCGSEGVGRGGNDRPPIFNYVQRQSRIKRYIDTKPNNELIHYCLQNPPYKFKWIKKTIPVVEGIDNNIYSIVDACLNVCDMWKAIERLEQGESINKENLTPLTPTLIHAGDSCEGGFDPRDEINGLEGKS
uniref:Uncharacterized protein n=1 Tax=Tanacetum cinerariifolium TaxID=118510 RepID=A0A6L2NWX8_TANCI|nr:hypothetical protein [Tanacetum cinerariifolium]